MTAHHGLSRWAALALLVAMPEVARASAPCGSPQAAAEVRASMDKARASFMRSVAASYARLQHNDAPIQVDLYVLAHYLLYQDELRFERDPKLAAAWRDKISRYFVSTFGKDLWEREGCLAIKVLTGLRLAKVPDAQVAPIARWYRDFIRQSWGKQGVGECTSPKVERTYGATTHLAQCGPVIDELVAKTAYYQVLTASAPDAMSEVPLPTLNEPRLGALETWYDVMPEEFIVRAHLVPGQKIVAAKRFSSSKKALAAAVAATKPSEKPVHTMFLGPLLFSSWAAGNPVDGHGYALLRALMATQQPDGRILSEMNALRSKGHDIDASPTYFGLMAMQAYLDHQATCR